MTGGAGNDQFIFTSLDDSTMISSNSYSDNLDLILDFTHGSDKIKLSGFGFNSIHTQSTLNPSTNSLDYYFDGKHTIIEDQNSNFAIKLAGEISLNNNDFIFEN